MSATTASLDSSFLGDLNIVAVPTSSGGNGGKLPARKKKNNKYERRRQKAKRAREQQKLQHSHQNYPKEEHSGEQEQKEENDLDVHEKEERLKKEVVMEDENEQQVPSMETPSEEHAANKRSNSPKVEKSQPTTTTIPTPAQAMTVPPPPPLPPPSSSSRRQHPQSHPNDDKTTACHEQELQRAEYLAEFHARPMELDRRSGARGGNEIVSQASGHLFAASRNWDSLDLHPRLLQTVRQSFSLPQPTTIQSKTIRAMTTGQQDKANRKNLLIHSETGSGKTLAYLLPILQSMAYGAQQSQISASTQKQESPRRWSRSEMGCRCIILCPTRELASQTLDVLDKLCQANFAGWLVPGGLLGGDSRQSEKSRIRKGLGVVVATPGRLLDHLTKTQSLLLHLKGKLQWLVLDECDRLVDMGLGDQVKQIVQIIRANEASKSALWWQSVLVSATVTPSVQALAKERMLCGNQEWLWIKGGRKNRTNETEDSESNEGATALDDNNEGYAQSTPRQLTQFHLTVTAKLRLSALVAFLVQRIHKGERTVVFMATCASVDYHYALFQALEDSLWDTERQDDLTEGKSSTKSGLFGTKAQLYKLHGSVPHAKRSQTMKQFNATTGATRDAPAVLLTTDVAARGLNLEGIDWTVQYDPPCEINDYVHRAGRTARAGKAGHSLLFLLPSEQKYLEVLEAKGVNCITPLSLSSLLNQAASVCAELTEAGMYQQGSGDTNTRKQSRDSLNSTRRGEYFSAEVQRRLEDCVVQDGMETRKAWKDALKEQRKQKQNNKDSNGIKKKEGQLLELARDAFLSFLRAYPTKKEPAVRSIFSSRALHLGHVAKSFALKEPPKSLACRGKGKRQKHDEEARDEQSNLPRSLAFGQGNDGNDSMQQNVLDELKTISNEGYDDRDHDDGRERTLKRPKLQQRNGKAVSAKELLLNNAFKMQSNLMDAM